MLNNQTGGHGHKLELNNRTEELTSDDAAWMLSNAFLILTMQSGFALLESGCVSPKNVANIMIKNTVDVTIGGLSYWMIGFAISFGRPDTPYFGYGNFFLMNPDSHESSFYGEYIFQFSFATTATTIVSGAVAERMKLSAYIIFSFINSVLYSFPANWVWNDNGFLKAFGFYDFAGGCVVHTTGGVTALVATLMLGPRLGRFTADDPYHQISSPVTALTGTFMLWWAWLGFNCGATFGINGNLWKQATIVGVNTLNGSIGGGVMGLLVSRLTTGHFHIGYIINSILGGLVALTGICGITTSHEALFIGGIGALLAIFAGKLCERLGIDDPVGVIPVHCVASCWGVLAVGLFGRKDLIAYRNRRSNVHNGLFNGGGLNLMGIQACGLAVCALWSLTSSFLAFSLLKHTIGLRMDPEDEIQGADWIEHKVRSSTWDSAAASNHRHYHRVLQRLEQVLQRLETLLNHHQKNPQNSQSKKKVAVEILTTEIVNQVLLLQEDEEYTQKFSTTKRITKYEEDENDEETRKSFTEKKRKVLKRRHDGGGMSSSFCTATDSSANNTQPPSSPFSGRLPKNQGLKPNNTAKIGHRHRRDFSQQLPNRQPPKQLFPTTTGPLAILDDHDRTAPHSPGSTFIGSTFPGSTFPGSTFSRLGNENDDEDSVQY